MKECIEKAMKDMGYKTKTEMTLIMRNYNRKKAKQEKEWEKMTTAQKNKFFREQTAITKLRSDWKKGYAVTKKRFLDLRPSFIPDLRYDRVTKQFIGLAQWSESSIRSGREVNLINQQEINLTKDFVAENFKPDVIKYVRKGTGRGGTKFI